MRWHEGELAVQRRAGVLDAAARVGRIIGDSLPAAAAAFLEQQPFLVTATVAGDGTVTASILGGAPGFARAKSETTIEVTPAWGHVDRVASDVAETRRIGVLAIEPRTRRRMRANGDGATGGGILTITTQEVYSNCPQHITPRKLVPQIAETPQSIETTTLTPSQAAWLRRADTFFIASSHAGAGADASHRGGPEGFVTVDGLTRVSFPDYRGNNMFNTLGNLERDPRCGLLFVDFAAGATLQLSGRASILWRDPESGAPEDVERLIEIDIDRVVETRQAVRLRETP